MSAANVKAMMGGVAAADLTSIENLKGSSFADTFTGNGGNNQLDGGGGNDIIDGGAGYDVIIGGGGNDRLAGGLGNDLLTGGTGSDVFVFNPGSGVDTITDFTHKQDKIDFAGAGAPTSFNQLTIVQVGADTHVMYGTDDIVIAGIAANTFSASDFLFH